MLMDMIKVAVIGMTGALLAMSLKNAKGDFSAYVNLGACVVVHGRKIIGNHRTDRNDSRLHKFRK